jgi:hypothetical protein
MIVADRESRVRLVADHYVDLMLIDGYFEDSLQGAKAPVVMALSGFVARKQQWEAFEGDWRDNLLGQFSLPYFKMQPCLTQPPRRPFDHLTTKGADAAASVAMSIIAKYADVGIGCALIIPDFKAVMKDASKKRHPFIRNQFSFLFFSVLEHALRESEPKMTADDKIATFFDYGSMGRVGSNWNKFKRTMDPKNRMTRVSFADDEWLYPLQAADAVAHLSCKVFLCRRFPQYDPTGQIEGQCQQLLQSLPSQIRLEWYDKDNLAPFIDAIKKRGEF